jgi:hypothetical protein
MREWISDERAAFLQRVVDNASAVCLSCCSQGSWSHQSAQVYLQAGLRSTDAFIGIALTGPTFSAPRLRACLARVCGSFSKCGLAD